ncbi:MAG: hypothetical protein Q4F65_13225 [Propionibacteriaceae bacterium]|nr:hypothetical protein [Propionibacteriaceae bacterium]
MSALSWSPAAAHGFGRFAGESGRTVGRTRFPAETALYTPPGWPEGVRPPHSPEWEHTATAFLLDCCPPDYRAYPVLLRHPVVLARFAAEHVESQVQACREGLGGVRASLGEFVAPEVLESALNAWHEQAELLRRRRREVALVEEALRGKVFIRKL